MIEHWVGKPKFMGAIRGYLAAHAWGNADADEFIASFRTDLGAPAAEVMQSFIDQPGVPIVSAAVRCEGGVGKVTLSQKRFFNAADQPPSLWKVPVCMKWQGGGAARCSTRRRRRSRCRAARRGSRPTPMRLATTTCATMRRRWRRCAACLPRAHHQGAHDLATDVASRRSRERSRSATRSTLMPTFLADEDLRVFRQGIGLFKLLNQRELDDNSSPALGGRWPSCSASAPAPSGGRRSRAKIRRWRGCGRRSSG